MNHFRTLHVIINLHNSTEKQTETFFGGGGGGDKSRKTKIICLHKCVHPLINVDMGGDN